MLDCSEFLDRYSDFRDGLLEHDANAAFAAHLGSCSSCCRYDRVVGGGVRVLRTLPEIRPSSDFEARLQNRIFAFEAQREAAHHASGASLMTTVGICAAIALAAWLPTVRPADEPVRLPPVVAHAPYHFQVAPVLFQAAPVNVARTRSEAPAWYAEGALLRHAARPEPVAAHRLSAFYYADP